MYNHLLYLGYWLVNTAVLFLAGFLIPAVRLGNGRFNGLESAFYAGFWLTFLIWLWWDFTIARKLKFEKREIAFIVSFIVNILSIWAVSRFYFMTGFLLTNYLWALGLGLAVTILQRMAWKVIVSKS